MTTTFEKFKSTRAGNYCTLPTKDVEILNPTPVCDTCEGELVWNPKGGWLKTGDFEHVGATTCTYARVRATCKYCGTNEKGVVVYKQHAWHDANECSRCGGVDGYAIGD